MRAAVFAMAALFSTTIAAAESPAPVRVVRARAAGGGETLRLTGSVTAAQRAGLSPRVSGLVATVHVDAGDRVKKGQLLVELDRALAELALRRARAGAAEARVRLAEAERLRSEAAELVRDKYIPETDAHARAAQVNIDSAVVARLEAEEREAAELVERHAVVAPFAGVISRKFSEAGEWVETGTPVLELVDIEHLRLDVQAPQERFADIDASTRVTVRLDGHPENRFAGRVAAVVPVNDPGARTFLVRVLLDDTGGRMIPGMSAEAIFDLAGNPDAVAVPRDALVRAPDGTDRVWVVEETDGDTRAFPRTVRVGRALTSTVEVVGGLEGDLPVVVRGNENLREGQPVEVIED